VSARAARAPTAALRCLLPLPEAACHVGPCAGGQGTRMLGLPGPGAASSTRRPRERPPGRRCWRPTFSVGAWPGKALAARQRRNSALELLSGGRSLWVLRSAPSPAQLHSTCAPNTGDQLRGANLLERLATEPVRPTADKGVCTSSKRPSSAASPCWAPAAALHPVTPRCR